MTESSNVMSERFEQAYHPRDFEEVCVLALDDEHGTDELLCLSVGIDSKVRAGIRGFVFELIQFNRHTPLEAGLGHLVQLMLAIYKRGALLNWAHGERFVAEWKRLKLLGIPPENFETEGEAVDALNTALNARRIRADLPRRLTNCGVSFADIANAAGLFENDVRRIAAGQQEPSDAVALLISSALDSRRDARE